MTKNEIDKLKTLADGGSAPHQQQLAKQLYWGNFTKKDDALAVKYYIKSFEQGFQLAEKGLRRMADEGNEDAKESLVRTNYQKT